ncbi:Transcriptional regulator [hydrothermal vent metagenome]|uniref:Transcriptional regulator n=1 Tax=hydrothermal vent metagenome TaxID=652676 RepID=A0A3B1E539_9ZZZZ
MNQSDKLLEKINPFDILTRLDWGESDDLEFKSAKGGLPQSMWETYSSMANSQGGVILLGVENDGTVSGLEDVVKLKKSVWDAVHNKGKVSINLIGEGDVVELEHQHKKILLIRIPRASRYQRPVYIGLNPLLGTYRRNYEGDYHCTEQEVSRMLSDRAEEPADSRILEHYSLEDLDRPSLQQYRQRFSSQKPTHPWISENDQEFLVKLGGWRKNRASGYESLTVAGLLMFGKEEVLREALPQYHIDYREKFSDDPDIRWTDRLTLDGTWAGNLFQFYLRVIQRLSADLKLPFQLDADLFRKGETVVHEAIRETLVNALIHADYQGLGGIIIEKYQDRFEFSNPGLLLISFDQLLCGNVSECRNKSLQTMFMMIGVGEKAGSGVDKIKRGWKSQHWRYPKIVEQVKPDRVQWMLPMESLIPDESLVRLKKQFGTKFQNCSKLEVQALVTADVERVVDNSRMRQITGEHATDITILLQNLVGKGLLVQEGQGRWTHYRLEVDSHNKDSDSHHKALHSHNKDSDSHHKALHSHNKDSDSLYSDEFSRDTWEDLMRMAKPSRIYRRLSPKKMEKIILNLCQTGWLTRRNLSDLLKRDSEGLRVRFIVPLVAHGRLRLRFPDKLNRTDQAYTAVDVVEEKEE